MAGVKFYSSPLSHNSLRPEMVMVEKGIDYETITLDLTKGEQKSPEMLSKAPWGKVPVLECPHAGPVYESRSIARYLATSFGDKSLSLIPPTSELPATARFEEGLAVEANIFDPDVTQLFFQRSHAVLMGMPVDNAAIEKSRKGIAATLKIMDDILAKQKYMGGDAFTLADIAFMPEFLALDVTGENEAVKSNPNVKRWWDEVSSRESWKKVSKPVWDVYTGIMETVDAKK